jgi:hypothetical protein
MGDPGCSKTASLRLLTLRGSDHAAGNARSRVACRLRFEIVRFRMNDHGATDNGALIFCERYLVIHVIQFRRTRSVGFDVAHVAHMPLRVIGSGVRFIRWIEMTASRRQIGGAAIAELMHVKTMLAGSQPGEIRLNTHTIGFLGECYCAVYFIVGRRMKDRDRFQWRRGFWLGRLRQRSAGYECQTQRRN